MEEEAPSRRSVAELAGRFKGLTRAHDAAGQEAEKPVRRRPPRSLQLPKPQGDDQEPPGVTSPLPSKAKRNSALIEKLQANLALSPSALLPSPKSPGFRLLPPTFPASSPGSNPVSTVTTPSAATPTSPAPTCLATEEEGPASFEAPPIVGEGAMLSNNSIKGRARHSIRRRPPSRRNKKSSSGDEVGEDPPVSSSTEPEDKTTGGEGEGGEETRGGGGEGGGEREEGGGGEGGGEREEGGGGEGGEGKGEETRGGEGGEKGEKGEGGEEAEEGEGGERGEETRGGEEGEGGGEAGGGGDVFKQEDQTDASMCPETNKSNKEDSEVVVEPREEDEKMKDGGSRSAGGGEEEHSSSGRKEEEEEAQEKNSDGKQKEDLTEGATAETTEQGAEQCSVR